MPRHFSKKAVRFLSLSIAAVAFVGLTQAAAAVDADSAMALAKQSGCFKCHRPDRAKDGPAWRDVAAKYKDKPIADAEKRLTEHMTSGEMVKFKDGHEEHHKIVKSDDPAEIKNLVDWILSLPGGTYNGTSYDLP